MDSEMAESSDFRVSSFEGAGRVMCHRLLCLVRNKWSGQADFDAQVSLELTVHLTRELNNLFKEIAKEQCKNETAQNESFRSSNLQEEAHTPYSSIVTAWSLRLDLCLDHHVV